MRGKWLVIGIVVVAFLAGAWLLQVKPTADSVNVWHAEGSPPWQSITIAVGGTPPSKSFSPSMNAEPTGVSIALLDTLGHGEIKIYVKVVCGTTTVAMGSEDIEAPPVNTWAWYTFAYAYSSDNPDYASGASCTLAAHTYSSGLSWGKGWVVWGEAIGAPTSEGSPGGDAPAGTPAVEGEESAAPPSATPSTPGPEILLVAAVVVGVIAVGRRRGRRR